MSGADGDNVCTFRGGAFIGDSRWTASATTWPFVVLMISANELIIARSGLLACRHTFPRTAIDRVVFWKRTLLPGISIGRLQIVHRIPDVSPYIVFGTFDPDRLESCLRSFGFDYWPKEARISFFRPSWKPLVFAASSLAAVALGLAFKFRLLPFLKSDFIISGGKPVSTATFAEQMSRMFFGSAIVVVVIGIVWFVAERTLTKRAHE